MKTGSILIFALLGATGLVADEYTADERSHWSFQRVVDPQIPWSEDAVGRAWTNNAIDAFVLVRLEENGLQPASPADRRTLIRRVFYHVTGLPPSRDEVAVFLADDAPGAYERLVDRLLASPRHGEQWAQHWLDVVRYAETEGFEYDRLRPGAWRYRDYVIDAFNSDKPYDQFVTEQLAGDEMKDDQQAKVAAGFHRLGPVRRNAGNAAVAFSRNEVLTERTNIIGTAFLAMTVGCARCHDHMFDAIRQRDYYQFQAFLAATYEHDIPLVSAAERDAWKTRTKEIKSEIDRLKNKLANANGAEEARLRDQIAAAEKRLPPPLPMISTVKNLDAKRSAIHVLDRGDPDRKRKQVAPRPLGVLLPPGVDELAKDAPRPKTSLARWIVSADNPLTARVIVNRLWVQYFGLGFVSTANDFGVNGGKPSHPELLDYLAHQLIANDWQLKPIHRMILLSGAFRQASRSPVAAMAKTVDPKNRLLWRFSRRRLRAEEVRDSMLQAAGVLHLKAGGPSVMSPVGKELVNLLYKPDQWQAHTDQNEHHRRSVYLMAKRNLRIPFLEVFDQPDLQTSCARRESSTHAPQALELLNGTLSNELANQMATRLRAEAGIDIARQVDLAFQIAAGRTPSDREKQLSIEFLKAQPLEEFSLAMFNLNVFLYID
ncbi:MAG: DUF1553 domain-containing protein [Planctomycetes bacterium]|nr:DUF1553 domain-containing protein [Planctomycetota bacterium]